MKRLPCLICIVNAKFIVCLIFIFVNFFFFLFNFLFLFKQHDFYDTVEFGYYVVIIKIVNLAKPQVVSD